jgi:hypothetical protein
MLAHRRVTLVFGILLLLLLVTLGATYYALNYPRFVIDAQQTLVYGTTQFSPETLGSLRVLVREPTLAQPIADANVTVRLEPKGSIAGLGSQTLFMGKTDARGTVPISFTIPASAARDRRSSSRPAQSAARSRRKGAVRRSHRARHDRQAPINQANDPSACARFGAMDRTPAMTEHRVLIDDERNKPYRNRAFRHGIAS